MKINKFEITKEENKIVVYVELPHAHDNIGIKKDILTTDQVIEMLQQKGVGHGKCIQNPRKLKNWKEYSRKGTWIFLKKVLDKPAENVIIEVEKEVEPKPARKRRTRSSTKKVSTEG